MKERITQIQHKGKTLLVVDYSNLMPQQVIELTEQLPEAFRDMQGDLRLLIDATNTRGSLESMASLKKVVSSARRGRFKKSACIGITGLASILLDGLNRVSAIPVRAFDSKAAALDWLAE
jgi:hypothetical protein